MRNALIELKRLDPLIRHVKLRPHCSHLNPQPLLDFSLASPELDGDPDEGEYDGHQGKEVGEEDHEEPPGSPGSGDVVLDVVAVLEKI